MKALLTDSDVQQMEILTGLAESTKSELVSLREASRKFAYDVQKRFDKVDCRMDTLEQKLDQVLEILQSKQ